MSEEAQQVDLDVDALLAQADAPQEPIPMGQPAPVEPVSQEPQYFEYTANGKQVKEPLDMVLKRASMGYDYAQKMEQFKAEKAEIERLAAQAKESESRWSQFDQYAREHPEWADHVHKLWEQRDQYSHANLDPEDPVVQQLGSLRGELQQVLEWKNQLSEQQRQLEVTAQDNQLKQDILGLREAYRDRIDFDSTDVNGYSLEARVLDHAVKHSFPTFQAAFRDYYHDELMKIAAETGKERVGQAVQQKTRDGLLRVSSTPPKKPTPTGYRKGQSYNEIADEILQELEAGMW